MTAVRAHPVVTMVVLTYGLTWVVWIPRAAGVDTGLVGRLWTWIPPVAALIVEAENQLGPKPAPSAEWPNSETPHGCSPATTAGVAKR
jgi:hypothetical protein